MDKETEIRRFQQRCFAQYASTVGLPSSYTYPDGNPIRPVLPVCTRVRSLMIVGAYPSARFEQRLSTEGSRHRLVPVADNLAPFAVEEYFDGIQTRRLTSGDGLAEYILAPLGCRPRDCWITDLVKVFLYKSEHGESCSAACPGFRVPVLRGDFTDIATKSLPWLRQEVGLAQPKLVITLGEEVARVVASDFRSDNESLLADRVVTLRELDDVPAILAPHPDACRRNPKWRDHLRAQMQRARGILSSVMLRVDDSDHQKLTELQTSKARSAKLCIANEKRVGGLDSLTKMVDAIEAFSSGKMSVADFGERMRTLMQARDMSAM